MTHTDVFLENRYQIINEIGRGGLSTVWKARDKRLDRAVAIKEIRLGEKFRNETMTGLFRNEMNIMKNLHHPGLPSVYDVIQDDNRLFIIMTYIEGESLDYLIRRQGAQEQQQVVEWGKQLCDILMYLHSHNPPIIYGDLKPSNIMLNPSGQLILIDFGSSFELGGNNLYHLVTQGFSPPEQYNGKVDERSDIYALGMTLYQLLTGVSVSALSTELKPVRQINPAIDKKLERIIRKCTQINPSLRFQSVKKLNNALNSLSGGKVPVMMKYIRSTVNILRNVIKRQEAKKYSAHSAETERTFYYYDSKIYDSEIIEYNAKLLLRLQNDIENTKW